jgi:hypothetical protein
MINDFELESIRNYDEVVEERKGAPPERPAELLQRPIEGASLQTGEAPRDDQRLEVLNDDLDSYAEPWGELEGTGQPDDAPSVRSASPSADAARTPDADEIRPWGYVEPRRGRPSDINQREAARPSPPSATKLWDDIPRCCRTCRDFRPAEAGGGGGWCTNRWAFRHRRMVDVDQLTCETTIGDWWLPTDDAWQDDFDVGRHALATPLMDKWFGRADDDRDRHYAPVASRARRRS